MPIASNRTNARKGRIFNVQGYHITILKIIQFSMKK